MGGGLRLLHVGGVGFLGVIAGPEAQGDIEFSGATTLGGGHGPWER